MKKIAYPLSLFAIMAIAIFFFFGRSYWYPVYVKIKGEQTVGDAVEVLKKERPAGFQAGKWRKLILLGFKEERVLEVWGISSKEKVVKIKEFPFTGFSGSLGPKLKQGDRQIPEGIYRIEYLNPNSSYHLSMKLSYPNEFDRNKGIADGRTDLGYDIFIHGRSATIGCIPIGDDGIEELFFMVAEVGKENVEVIISPYDMRKKKKEIEIAGIDWESELYNNIQKALAETKTQPVASGQHRQPAASMD